MKKLFSWFSSTRFYDAFFDYKFVNTFANGMRMIGSTEGPRGLKLEGDEGWIFIHVHGAKLEASNPALLPELDEWKKQDGALHQVRRRPLGELAAHVVSAPVPRDAGAAEQL